MLKGTLWVKYESDWAKERENMLQISDIEWTDRLKDIWMEGQTDHYRAPAEWGPDEIHTSI